MFFAICGIICLIISLTIPIMIGESFSNLFNNISLLNSTDLISVVIAENSISLLLISLLLFLLSIICLVLSINDFMNTKPLGIRKLNNLGWKKSYKKTEFYDKVIDELENAYIAVQNLKQKVKTLEEKIRTNEKSDK